MAGEFGRWSRQDWQLISEAVYDYRSRTGIGVAGQSDMLGHRLNGEDRSPEWLYKFMDGTRPVPWVVLREIARYTEYRPLIEHVVHELGAIAYFPPTTGVGGQAALLELIREYTEASSAAAEALEDGVVSSEECERCERELNQAIARALELQGLLLSMRPAHRDERAGGLM